MGRGIAAAAGVLAISMSTVPVAAAHGGSVGATDGSYRVVVDHAPRGVEVHPLQGRVPGFFVEVAAGHRLVVRTAEGVDLASIGASGTVASGSWLEERVRMPGQPPAHGHLAVVSRWRVPVTYDGAPGAIRGVVEWVPSGPHDDEWVRSGPQDDRSIPTGFMFGVGGGALAMVAVGLARVRKRARAAP